MMTRKRPPLIMWGYMAVGAGMIIASGIWLTASALVRPRRKGLKPQP
jgi:hypothetical protein